MVKITNIEVRENYSLFIELDNGKKGIFDAKPFLDKGIFKELRDLHYFTRFTNKGRSIEWVHEQDFSADTLEALMVLES